MSEERMRKVSMQMIFHCAPTFQRLKPSSLIMIDPEDFEVLERQTAQAGLSGCSSAAEIREICGCCIGKMN